MFSTMGRFLQRLRKDTAGNTLAIVGAALIPITAMIGSGLDVSRAYMAKSRLQSACDAASLAARRVMRNDLLTEDVIQTGEDFFRFNFAENMYGTADFTPAITRPEVGLVRIDADTRIPTTVMRLFGFDSLPLSVECEASLNFVNTDVVLVLDVTGSMNETLSGTTKIDALHDAVMALYDELAPIQAQLESQGLRLRYGVVPYSSTVNVGNLLADENPNFIRTSTPYSTRVATFNTLSYPANTPTTTSGWEVHSSTRSSSQCSSWVGTGVETGGGPAPTATTRTTYSGNSSGGGYSASTNWGYSGAAVTTGTNRTCRRWRSIQTTTYTTVRNFTSWTHRTENLNTTNFRNGNPIAIATNGTGTIPNGSGSGPFNPQQLAGLVSGGQVANITWNGCIEERDTVTSISGGTSLTIPGGANDLNLNLIPTSEATRWRPMLPEAVFTRTAGSATQNVTGTATSTTNWLLRMPSASSPDPAYWACPTEARRLQEWTRDDLDTYIGSLTPIGGTYHDIGMIWGGRFISTGGVFADGCEEFNEMPCNRHVIFMTDDQQTAYCNVYTTYGMEQNDMRTTGAGSCPSQLARHQQRFQMACNATKNMNTSLWVIAFGTSLNASLTNCASNASQASTSGNRAQLIARFRQIGNQIGALRLTS